MLAHLKIWITSLLRSVVVRLTKTYFLKAMTEGFLILICVKHVVILIFFELLLVFGGEIDHSMEMFCALEGPDFQWLIYFERFVKGCLML